MSATLPATALVRVLACAIALAGCEACSATKPDDPRLDATAAGFALYLPGSMRQSLDAFSPGLRLIQPFKFRSDVREAANEAGAGTPQALFAAIGDFDGDGTQDVVVEGTSPVDSSLVVIAILNGAKPKAFEIVRNSTFDADAVGIYLARPVRPKPGAFELVNYPDASTLYFYRDGKFVGMQTSG